MEKKDIIEELKKIREEAIKLELNKLYKMLNQSYALIKGNSETLVNEINNALKGEAKSPYNHTLSIRLELTNDCNQIYSDLLKIIMRDFSKLKSADEKITYSMRKKWLWDNLNKDELKTVCFKDSEYLVYLGELIECFGEYHIPYTLFDNEIGINIDMKSHTLNYSK